MRISPLAPILLILSLLPMALGPEPAVPQDVVAIFHAAFHPTQGNVVDWALKADDSLSLDGVEFSCLPSGLHLVEHDVVYFDKDGHQGVCIFRRRRTAEAGQRNFRLSSIGILLAKSRRPRAWRHVDALKQVTQRVYELAETEERDTLALLDKDLEPARAFFEERRVRSPDLGGAGDWFGWLEEFNNGDPELANPALHIPHLLRILGPSCLTLYKHVIARRRILIYTLPPVEAACILSQVAADICLPQHPEDSAPTSSSSTDARTRSRSKDPIVVLGMVTLSDVEKMTKLGQNGNGWIACTTDALFMERPQYYDLLIDLTTSTPNKATRPTMYVSKAIKPQPARGATHRLSTIRFVWSDVKLWNELSPILDMTPEHKHVHDGSDHPHNHLHPRTASQPGWTDVWRVYEDVCIVCAGLWMGSWRGNSKSSYSTLNPDGTRRSWGAVRRDGDDDFSFDGTQTYVRSVGRGIEGGVDLGDGGKGKQKGNSGPSATRRWTAPELSKSSPDFHEELIDTQPELHAEPSTATLPSSGAERDSAEDGHDRSNRTVQITLLLLQTFEIHTSFLLARLASFLPSSRGAAVHGSPIHDLRATSTRDTTATAVHGSPLVRDVEIVYLKPRDILAFELGPLSELDALFVEWLADVYGGGRMKIVVRRGWRDFFGLITGFS